MPCNQRLEHTLREAHVDFELRRHDPVMTAQEVAAVEHVSGREVAKVVMVGTDRGLAMAVLPANERCDIRRVAEAVGARDAWLAHEEEFSTAFPDCEPGAMPAFGHLWGIPTVVDSDLAQREWILTQAGTHRDAVRLRFHDYERVERPTIVEIGRNAH